MTSPRNNRSHLNLRWPQTPSEPFPSVPPPQPHASSSDPWNIAPVPPRLRVHSSVHLQHLPPTHSPSSSALLSFPEPELYRSASDNVKPGSSSYRGLGGADLHRGISVSSSTSSFYRGEDDYIVEDLYLRDGSFENLIDDINRISLDADEAVRRFQKGELRDSEQEWHKMIPMGAVEALGKQEVQRQSIIFEVIKGERDYVADLRTVQDVLIKGLTNASDPIINPSRLPRFVRDVFANWDDILRHHERILAALFQRQKNMHPLIQSVSDIILDTVLKSDFRSAYEDYIKHYPISESIHRKELKSNSRYKNFLDSVSDDPRIRKRDLITFLSRPVTRLPRLSLLLEQILKFTDKDSNHEDLELLPTILSILNNFLKSTQPGIEAAESKAKLWELCEHLEYQKGEIIDMNLDNESRTLVYSGPVVRRVRGETGFSTLIDLTATLLDNYFILTRDVRRPNGATKKQLMSRPIPLSHLQYGSFDGAPESRREKSEDGGILESLRYQSVEIYPFTIFHASSPLQRRYILLVTSEALRRRWKSVLDEAIGLYKATQEASMWYDPRTLTDDFFRSSSARAYTTNFTGQALTATPFTSGGRKFVAVGCRTGIYASTWGTENFKRALNLQNPVQLASAQELGEKEFHRLVVQNDHTVSAYSLDILARIALGQAQSSTLEATMERVAGSESNVLFFKMAEIGQRLLLMYASKRLLQVSPSIHVLEAIDVSGAIARRSRTPTTFRPFGESGYVPKDATDIRPLTRTIGIVTRDGIVIADPTNFATSSISVVPDLHSGSDPAISLLKDRVAGAKPLGFIRVTPDELMVVYDTLGCYMTKYGVPTRSAAHIKWETQAQSYAYRSNHVLLFSAQFIEIRDMRNGRIVQVIEGINIRLLYFNETVGNRDPIIVGMKGKKDDRSGASDRIVELAETVELKPVSPIKPSTPVAAPVLWDEWDM